MGPRAPRFGSRTRRGAPTFCKGLAPHTSGVYSNYQDWREVITEYTSLGKYLRDHGYYSAGAGNIYHYHMVDQACWDEYWPSQEKNMPAEYLPNASEEEKEVDGRSLVPLLRNPEDRNVTATCSRSAFRLSNSYEFTPQASGS